MEPDDAFSLSVTGLVFGIILFFRGFRSLWRKRLIQNTPLSTVRSLAVGPVELYGRAEGKNLLTTFFAKEKCLYFHSIQERFEERGKKGCWVKEMDFKSEVPFFLNDGTGRIFLDPTGAETELDLRYTKRVGDMRYREYYVMPGEFIYVLGTVRPFETVWDLQRRAIERKSIELEKDYEKRALLDLNQDGWIDQEEWQIAREAIAKEVAEEFRAAREKEEEQDVYGSGLERKFVGKGEPGSTFLISLKSEKELVRVLHRSSTFSIWSGGVIILLSFALLLHTLTRYIH